MPYEIWSPSTSMRHARHEGVVIRITPRAARLRQIGEPIDGPGRLAATLLSVAAAGLMDPARFRRGKQLAGDDGVLSFIVDAGMLRSSVQGSRSAPYEVTVLVPTVMAPPTADRASMTRLAPQGDELDCACSCPDGMDGPCKHVAATLLAFAAEVSSNAALLVAWRCGETAAQTRARAGSGVGATSPSPALRPQPPVDPFSTSEWQAWFGFNHETIVVEIPDVPLRRGREMFGNVDLAAWLARSG